MSTNKSENDAIDYQRSIKLQEILKNRFSSLIESTVIELSDLVVKLKKQDLLVFMQRVKLDPQIAFNFLVDITAVDWLDQREARFEVVYHLLSLEHLYRLRVKVDLQESDANIDSIVALWPGANYMERETWDMYGVNFRGNSDQRRLLLYDEFVGHPLRKDYPIQKKQPRVKLIAPEVKNTALDMRRPDLSSQLVQIGASSSSVERGKARMVSRGN